MAESTTQGLGSGVPVHTVLVAALALVVLLACLGRLRAALFLPVPTLILAGVANILAWLAGSGSAADTTPSSPSPQQPTSTAPHLHEAAWSVTGGHQEHGPSSPAMILLGLVLLILVAGSLARVARHPPAGNGWATTLGDPEVDQRLWSGLGPLDVPYVDLSVTNDLAEGHEVRPTPERPERERPLDPVSRRVDGRRRSHERLSARLSWLATELLRSSVARPGRPARIDLADPDTHQFLAAFSAAADLLIDDNCQKRPTRLTAAVREAERQWLLLRKAHDEHDRDIGDNPAADER